MTTRSSPQRGFWIGIVGVLAFAGLVSASGAAYGRTSTVTRTSQCSDLVKKYQKVNQAAQNVDFTNAKAVSKALKQAAQELRSLGKNGPSALRPSFKRLAAAYDKLAKLDFSNQASFTQLTSVAETLVSDFEKIAAYAAKQCGFTIPTGSTSSTPTT